MEFLANTGVGAIVIGCLVLAAVIFTRALDHRWLRWIFTTTAFLLLAWSMGEMVRLAWEIHQRIARYK